MAASDTHLRVKSIAHGPLATKSDGTTRYLPFIKMSTGHRPTFHPAVGKQVFGGGSGYHIVSVKDQLGQKNLKFRKFGQSSQNEIRSRDYKAELEIIEEEHLILKKKELARITSSRPEKIPELPLLLNDAPMQSTDELRKKYDDSDAENGDSDKELVSR